MPVLKLSTKILQLENYRKLRKCFDLIIIEKKPDTDVQYPIENCKQNLIIIKFSVAFCMHLKLCISKVGY